MGEIAGTKVYQFTPNGTKKIFAELISLEGIALSGMTIDPNDNLYVSNYVNGKIHKIMPDGTAVIFSDLSTAGLSYTPFTSYLTFANNNIYATGLVANRIYKITLAGQVTVLAGTGEAGSQDGIPSIATFTEPNGIVADPSGNILYISESTSKRLRRIISLKKL